MDARPTWDDAIRWSTGPTASHQQFDVAAVAAPRRPADLNAALLPPTSLQSATLSESFPHAFTPSKAREMTLLGHDGGVQSQFDHRPNLGGDWNSTTLASPAAAPSTHNAHGAWRSFPFEESAMTERHFIDAPPNLQISTAQQDLSSTAPVSDSRSYDSRHPHRGTVHRTVHGTNTPNTTSLPSFASLQEHANRSDETEETDIAPMSSRLACYLCTKLKPLVREVALAVAELDEGVQNYCRSSAPRTPDFPQDSPTRTVQWILERLKFAKGDLQDLTRTGQADSYYAQQNGASYQNPYQNLPPRKLTPSNPLKRPTDLWDHYNDATPKCPRSGASPDEYQQRSSILFAGEELRASLDFAPKDPLQPTGYSPPTTESLPGSALPRSGSPTLPGRSRRALPSPSSLVPGNGQSIGSPALSCQPGSSIHTASTSSATSAHIADLQHQVTLKSLALQTLQSEYASLLQKLQRERVKSQTIEKKTNVADQEVNELTSKNEDLIEQIKVLESRLEESEGKREVERSETAKEKEQWRRMLEMGGRLHAKHAEQMQSLRAEKVGLEARLAAYETNKSHHADPHNNHARLGAGAVQGEPRRELEFSDKTAGQESLSAFDYGRSAASEGNVAQDYTALTRENAVLTTRIANLRSVLQAARRCQQDLNEHSRKHMQLGNSVSSMIERAMHEVGTSPETTAERQDQDLSECQDDVLGPGHPRTARSAHRSPSPKEQRTLTMDMGTSRDPLDADGQSPSRSRIHSATVSAVRTVSPPPAELGHHVSSSISSPEELIQALGPVPTVSSITRQGEGLPISFDGQQSDAIKAARHIQQRRISAGSHSDTARLSDHEIRYFDNTRGSDPHSSHSILAPNTHIPRQDLYPVAAIGSPSLSLSRSTSSQPSPASSSSIASNLNTPASNSRDTNDGTIYSYATRAQIPPFNAADMLPNQEWRTYSPTPFGQVAVMAPPPRPFQA